MEYEHIFRTKYQSEDIFENSAFHLLHNDDAQITTGSSYIIPYEHTGPVVQRLPYTTYYPNRYKVVPSIYTFVSKPH